MVPMGGNTGGKKKFYLTREGLNKIKKEYQELLRIKNLKTKGEIPSVFDSQDLNPEYFSFQEDMNLLEIRISELENVLKNVELIKTPSKTQQGVVVLGATVVVEVGPD